MSSPVTIPKHVTSEKYVPVHKRSPSPISTSPTRQVPAPDVNKRPSVYSITELLQLSKSPLVQTSLTSEQKQGIADVMVYIPQPQRQAKSRSPSPAKSSRSPSPTTTKSKRVSSPTKKAKRLPASETSPSPKVDTPPSPRRKSSRRRPAETNTNTSSDSGHQYHRRKQWGYAPSFHHNEDNWRVHPSVAIVA
ncbi:hypothetical protein BDM02DRAFT_3108850 [Thelephora ganbajun]|uniref:Uncharacterized protein n=1 Tax=Thelephora ganbajun TaxID=370292 RepID=A0ACB6ZT87_THEGA|nr:hypothetical protein BDM02DRAFT_3108850 [Thelephora ganbajun]